MPARLDAIDSAPARVRLSSAALELEVLVGAGPRVIALRRPGGRSVLADFGVAPAPYRDWQAIGGHRLWHAPESFPRTYAPDNDAVPHEWDGATLRLRPAREAPTGIRKEIDITLDRARPVAWLRHRLVNEGPWPVACAPWTLTVMAPGGECVVPQEPFGPHPEFLAPARPLVLWPYTDMADPRWTWGRHALRLRQDRARPQPQKVGAFVSAGWAAYLIDGLAFVKSFGARRGTAYPDGGCNFETFTNEAMLEVESLAPLQELAPGEASAEHVEAWTLAQLAPAADEQSLVAQLANLSEPLP